MEEWSDVTTLIANREAAPTPSADEELEDGFGSGHWIGWRVGMPGAGDKGIGFGHPRIILAPVPQGS